jgi:Ribonuclease G/E
LNENQVEKDRKRQQIIGNILKCKFVRILQSGEIRIFDYSKNKH